MHLRNLSFRAWSLIGLTVVALVAAWAALALRSGAERQPGAAAQAYSDPFAQESEVRYDIQYPAIGYLTATASDPIARLEARLEARGASLTFSGGRGYLDSLLEALDIDPASQVLVFSTTSLQVGHIRPATPRAIYFNDETYVAWVQGGDSIEIAAMDPKLGPVFYTLEQRGGAAPGFDRQAGQCLRCHDSLSLSGGGVPRFILGSGYIGTLGNIVAHEGWILTDQSTPLNVRWGGWYVTGHHGDQVHLGNIVVKDPAQLQHLENLRIGNLDDLDALFDTSPYITNRSDIVALMVIQHQVDVQNAITLVNFKVRTALAADAQDGTRTSAGPTSVSATTRRLIASVGEPLVQTMLFANEAQLTSPITGSSGFAEQFESRGPQDEQGRSLRELDLTPRLFRYPLSYLVYSAAFDALPAPAKDYVYRRFAEVLRGEDQSEEFANLTVDDRHAILEILRDTKPEFAAALAAHDAKTAARSAATESAD